MDVINDIGKIRAGRTGSPVGVFFQFRGSQNSILFLFLELLDRLIGNFVLDRHRNGLRQIIRFILNITWALQAFLHFAAKIRTACSAGEESFRGKKNQDSSHYESKTPAQPLLFHTSSCFSEYRRYVFPIPSFKPTFAFHPNFVM